MNKISQLIEIIKYSYFISGLNPIKLFSTYKIFIYYYVTRKFSPEEILLYNLASVDNACKYKKYIYSNEEYLAVQDKLNPHRSVYMTESKIDFYNLCQTKGIPTPKTFFSLRGSSSTPPKEQTLKKIISLVNSLPDGNFIAKPSTGTHGDGIWGFSKSNNSFQLEDGETINQENFAKHVNTLCSDRDFIIQARVKHHSNIEKFSPSKALQTLRIHSLITEDNSLLLFSKFKQAGDNKLTDNFNMGKNDSISWTVDLKTGKLTHGYQINSNGYGYKEVPLSNLNMEHQPSIPYWQETLSLVKKAAKEFLPLKTVGWDIAVTNDGPMIIEGNCFFDPASSLRDYNKLNIYQRLKDQAEL